MTADMGADVADEQAVLLGSMSIATNKGTGYAAGDNAEFKAFDVFCRVIERAGGGLDFRTFDDVQGVDAEGNKTRRNLPELRKKFSGKPGDVWADLQEMNRRGAGVFIVVNQTDGKGQKAGNVVKVRAVFADADGAPLEPLLAMTPHICTETSLGRYSIFWLVGDCPIERFSAVQTAIAKKFGTDKSVNDLPRVMRLPGFLHQKGTPFRSRALGKRCDPKAPIYSMQEIITGLGLDLNAPTELARLPESSGSDAYAPHRKGNAADNGDLMAVGSDKFAPYPFDDERENFLGAANAAVVGGELDVAERKGWRTWMFACCFLVIVHKWPESETGLIYSAVCDLAPDADKSDNERQWAGSLERTRDAIEKGTPVTTHLAILKLARAAGWKPKAQTTDALAAIQNDFALISLSGKVGIVDRKRLDATSSDGVAAQLEVMNRADGGLLVERRIAREFPQVDARKLSAAFIRDKETILYNGVEFNPRTSTPGVLNLWVSITIAPKSGGWPLIRVLLLEVLCGGRHSEYQYLIQFIAHALQKPWEKPGVMVILLGGQGIGKGTLARILQKIWSATFLHVHRINQVVGDFNGALERTYIVFLDEALFAGDRASSDALKSLVTEQTLNINEKHQPSRQIRSYHRFFSATNADWFKSTERDDRRDFVLRVSEHRKGDFAFWEAINAEIENGGGVEAFAHELLAMDLTNFNVRSKPNTRELTEQKLQSLDKFPRWWFDCLSRGAVVQFNQEWPEFVSSATLLAELKESEKGVRTFKQLIDRDITAYMAKLCPSAQREQGMEGTHRRRGYRLPPLEKTREDFERYIGGRVEWEML